MSRLSTRPVRVIASSGEDSSRSAGVRLRRSRQADFGSLLRRDGALPGAERTSPGTPIDDEADTPRREELTLAQRIGSASQRVVAAVLRREQQMLELAHLLAQHIAELASNAAIRQAGHWEIAMWIDPQCLPGTHLHLTLSHAVLLLRFDAEGTDTRELLLQHASLLEREMRHLLAVQGESRTLELTVH